MTVQHTDARQTPSDRGIEAGAIALMETCTNFATGINHTHEDVANVWASLSGMEHENFRRQAKAVLTAAKRTTAKE